MTTDDSFTLSQDSKLAEEQQRVAFQPGMLLGVEATREEQRYHRHSLTMHQYWLHGWGTLLGLPVTVEGDQETPETESTETRLLIGPGIALDGLGRKVISNESYCLDLKDWLAARTTEEGIWKTSHGEIKNNGLWLEVYVRQRDCQSGLQPTLVKGVNASIDPVKTSRVKEVPAFSLKVVEPFSSIKEGLHTPMLHAAYPVPGKQHEGASDEPVKTTNDDEAEWLSTLSDANKTLYTAYTDRLYRFGSDTKALDIQTASDQELDKLAQVLLARIRIGIPQNNKPIANPKRVLLNNMVRPFVTTPDVLLWAMNQQNT